MHGLQDAELFGITGTAPGGDFCQGAEAASASAGILVHLAEADTGGFNSHHAALEKDRVLRPGLWLGSLERRQVLLVVVLQLEAAGHLLLNLRRDGGIVAEIQGVRTLAASERFKAGLIVA